MKKHASLLSMVLMSVSLVLGGYGRGGSGIPGTESQAKIQTKIQTKAETGGQAIAQSGDKTAPGQALESPFGESSSSALEPDVGGELNTGSDENKLTCQAAIRVGSLKGLTSMGFVSLMDKVSKDETPNVYEFTTAGKADELVGKIINGDLDIALVSTNTASVFYAKTRGNITILDTNTLGAFYTVTSDDSITSMAGLKGRTICITGKGTTPEYVMSYLLKENDLPASDVDLQLKSEATEAVSLLKQDSSAIGALSQPSATAVYIRNSGLKIVLDLAEQWNILNKDSESMLMTDVALVHGDFLRENRSPVVDFIEDHEASALFAKEHTEDATQLIVRQGTMGKAPIVQKALPYCNIAYLTGQEMKNVLSGYLSVLNEQGPRSIGGQMSGGGFYYMP